MRQLHRGPSSARRSKQGSRKQPSSALLERIGEALGSDRGRFVAFCAFLSIVALTGGGSRPDIQSLVILRPVAVCALFYGLWFMRNGDLRGAKVPLAVILGLMVIAICQLIPLPWSVWTELPKRSAIAEIDTLLGMAGVWRPLSLDPARTWNTLFALLVPLAAIVLFCIQSGRYVRMSLLALVALALASAAVGYLQAIGIKALHFYAITHDHHPVGLFSNKNHQAVLLVWLLMTVAWLATIIDPASRKAKAHAAAVLATLFVIFPLILLSGSRAGLLMSFPALMISLWFLSRSKVYQFSAAKKVNTKRVRVAFILIALIILLAGVFSVLALSDRQAALSRLFASDPADEMRWIFLPLLWEMTGDFFVLGTGFGAFAATFHMYESTETLGPGYLNQAHLDPLQLIIEGGIPALILAAWGLVWLVWKIFALWMSGKRPHRDLAVYLASAIGVWFAASLIDYPLRAPIISVVFAILTAHLGISSVRAGRDMMRQPSESTRQRKQ